MYLSKYLFIYFTYYYHVNKLRRKNITQQLKTKIFLTSKSVVMKQKPFQLFT